MPVGRSIFHHSWPAEDRIEVSLANVFIRTKHLLADLSRTSNVSVCGWRRIMPTCPMESCCTLRKIQNRFTECGVGRARRRDRPQKSGMSRRGTRSRSQAVELRELVTIRQFRDLPEVLLAKGSLESAGIECFLVDENIVRLDWFISNLVRWNQVEGASRRMWRTREKFSTSPFLKVSMCMGVGLYEQPRCPKCDSLDVNFRNWIGPLHS